MRNISYKIGVKLNTLLDISSTPIEIGNSAYYSVFDTSYTALGILWDSERSLR